MYYLLVLLLSLLIQSEAQQNSSETRRTIDDSFDVNIGAGYGVGPDQSSDSLPRSTTKIIRTRDYPSNDLSRNVVRATREPRILTNFTPIQIHKSNSQMKSQNRIYDFTHFDNPPSSGFEDNSLKSYRVHESLPDDDKQLNGLPKFIQLQKVIKGLDKPHTKIVEVIKVPATYEIHVQKNDDESSITDFTQNGESHWKIHGKYKPIFNDFSTKFSEDKINWLKNYYKKKEEEYLNQNEKYKDEHISNPVDFHENFEEPPPIWNNENLHEEVLEPVLAHHYKHFGNFENKHDKDSIHHNSDPSNKLRYSPWKDEDYTYDKNKHYANNDLKRDAGLSSFKSNSPAFKHVSVNKLSQTKKSELYKIHNKLDTFSSPTEFKRNQEFTEFSQPQALHEVPAPYLGKYPRPKTFEGDSLTKSNDFVPQHKIPSSIPTSMSFYHQEKKSSGSSYNQLDDSRPNKSFGVFKSDIAPSAEDFVSSIKENQHFIYGKRTEHVLSPNEIDLEGSTTTQRGSIYSDDYRRSYGISHSEDLEPTKTEVLINKDQRSTDSEINLENSSLITPTPNVLNISGENDTTTFNKKSDTIYSDYNKKDAFVDDYDNIDSWDMSMPMPMKPVHKSNYFTIYPKKGSDEKSNLLHNVHTADYGRNIKYYSQVTSPLKENTFSYSTKTQNKSKHVEPVGYVIYITKKSTEKK